MKFHAKNIKDTIRALYTAEYFYYSLAALVMLFVAGYFYDFFFLMAKFLTGAFLFLCMLDFYQLFISKKDSIRARRDLPTRLSNGDENFIKIYLQNTYSFKCYFVVIDEIPYQFQVRNMKMAFFLKSNQERIVEYALKPTIRGEYHFGYTNIFVRSPLQLFSKRYRIGPEKTMVKVYPSFLNMRKYELIAIADWLPDMGIKKTRQKGAYTEFEQINEYVRGDNYRTINWKATAKRARLMVNHYQEERSQKVYLLIDMGRVMKMPFHGMTLLDYAINSSVAFANAIMLKHDHPGLITFNDKVKTFQEAKKKTFTLQYMMENLYNQETLFGESNYDLLTLFVKRKIKQRSLLVLFTNFEHVLSLQRQLKYFRMLAQKHLLLVIIFENTEIDPFINKRAESIQDIYQQTIAHKFRYEKRLMIKELNRNGILTIYTRPGNLTLSAISKYIEIKNKGLF